MLIDANLLLLRVVGSAGKRFIAKLIERNSIVLQSSYCRLARFGTQCMSTNATIAASWRNLRG